MSSHVHGLNIGETIDIKGPFVKYDWNTKAVKNAVFVLGKIYKKKKKKKRRGGDIYV
jgi:NAD(P)H-flavin reductase